MKLQSTAKLRVIAKGEPTKSMDGKSTYYKVTVMQGAEAGQLSVSEELYNLLVADITREVPLIVEYNDQYKSLRVVNIDYTAMTAMQYRPATTPSPAPVPGTPAPAPAPVSGTPAPTPAPVSGTPAPAPAPAPVPDAPAPDAPVKNGKKS